jgi:hypothetical protein
MGIKTACENKAHALIANKDTNEESNQHNMTSSDIATNAQTLNEEARQEVFKAATSAMPQNVVLSQLAAQIADQMRADAKNKLQRDIAMTNLAFPVENDTPALRMDRALQTDIDMDIILSQGNGISDTVPPTRTSEAMDLEGAPESLGVMPSFWNADELERLLTHHPNRELVEYVLNNLRNGADLQMVMPPGKTFKDIAHVVGRDAIPKQRANINRRPEVARQQVQKYLAAGTLVVVPLGTSVIIHPIDIVESWDSVNQKWKERLIHDMSDKKNKISVNDITPRHLWQIARADHAAVAALIRDGMSCALIRDIKSAYRTLAVRPSQQCLQCFYLDGVCYASLSLTFGNRAAGFIWDSLAALVHWIIEDRLQSRFGKSNARVTHIGDDFCTAMRYTIHLAEAETIVDQILIDLGDRAGREKNQTGFRVAYIGMTVDLFEGKLSIKPDRLDRLIIRFDRAANDSTARYNRHELLSLAGNVAYISTHSAGALVFARNLYAAANSPYVARGRAPLTAETRHDIRAMLYCITKMSYLSITPTRIIFLDTDASGKHGGAGALSANWLKRVPFLYFAFPPAFLTHAEEEISMQLAETLKGGQRPSSSLLELCAMTIAIISFRELLRDTTVVVCSDSTATIHAMTKMYSALPRTAQLLKYLAAVSVSHNIMIAPVHRPRELLAHVDALTHYDIAKFRTMVPRAAKQATTVAPRVLQIMLDPNCVHETADIFELLK